MCTGVYLSVSVNDGWCMGGMDSAGHCKVVNLCMRSCINDGWCMSGMETTSHCKIMNVNLRLCVNDG